MYICMHVLEFHIVCWSKIHDPQHCAALWPICLVQVVYWCSALVMIIFFKVMSIFGENTFSNTKKTETRQAMSAKSFPQQSEATFKDGSQILSRASNFKPPNMPGMLPCFFWWPILRTFPLHQRFQLFPWRKMKRCMAIFLVILSALLLGHLGNIWMCLKTGGYRDTLQMACWWTIEFGGFPSKQTNLWLSCLYRLAPHRMLWLFAYRKPASIGGFCFFWFYRVVY